MYSYLFRTKEKEIMSKKIRFRGRNVIASVVLSILVSAAIRDQLQRPPEERTWQGKVFGLPYDFRFPTVERLQAAFWNKDTAQVLVPQPFGIGWTINFYPLLHPQQLQSIQ